MKTDTKEIIKLTTLLIAVLIMLAVFLGYTLNYKAECAASGGSTVRGVLGYACVKGV
jgi:hypothetical protein